MMKFGSKKDLSIDYKCTIRLLDDNEVLECEFQSYHKGRYLKELVCGKLNLVETDYFGLRYVDQNKQRHWLDPNKNILKQIKNLSPILFCFRVKFYPADPIRLQEEITRYQLFLQLRRDLLHGRLYCSQSDAATLAAYIVQAELGDYDADQHGDNYLSDFKILLKQTPKIEERIAEIHRSLKSQTPSTAETNFLKKAALLDTYGVDPHPVKDHRGSQLYLGLNHAGVLTFQGSRRTHHFRWSDVQKLNYEGKMFIVHLIFTEDARTKKKHTVGFKCPTASSCRHLWRCAVEQRLFFTLENSHKHGVVVTGGSFFSRGSRFRYSGRCEKEVIEDSSGIVREPPTVKRVPLRNIGRSTSLPTTPADSDTYDTVMSRVHRPLPYIDRSSSLDEEVLCGADLPTNSPYSSDAAAHANGAAYCPESTLPPLSLLEPLLEAHESKSRSSSIHDTSWDDSALQQHLYYDFNCRGHTSEFADTSSTETLDNALRIHKNSSGKGGEASSGGGGGGTGGGRREGKSMGNGKRSGRHHHDKHSSGKMAADNNGHLRKTPPKCLSVSSASRISLSRRSCVGMNRFLRVFGSALLLVLLLSLLFVVLVFESDLDCLEALRSAQDMVVLRIQYYEPLKGYIVHKLPL